MARLLCAKDERLTERVKPLLEMAEASSLEKDVAYNDTERDAGAEEVVMKAREDAQDLEMSVLEMERRLMMLQEKPAKEAMTVHRVSNVTIEHSQEQTKVCSLLAGWHCAPSDWTPTPIGCLNGKVPHLVLSDL